MVKDHSDSERGNPLPPYGLLFNSKGSFIWLAHTTTFVTPVMEHWLEWEIAQQFPVHNKESITHILKWRKHFCIASICYTIFYIYYTIKSC